MIATTTLVWLFCRKLCITLIDWLVQNKGNINIYET